MSTLTVMIAPCSDLLGPGSRVRIAATRSTLLASPLAHYRTHSAEWVEVGQMRARTHAEIKRGHYWKVVCIEPFVGTLAECLEHALSPATFNLEIPDDSPTDPTPRAAGVFASRAEIH